MTVQPIYQFCRVGKSNFIHLAGHPRRTLCGRPRGDAIVLTYQGIRDVRACHICTPCLWKAYRFSVEAEAREVLASLEKEAHGE